MAEVIYNGQKHSTESEVGKEALKHERSFDYRPELNPYPCMMYRAHKGSDGVVRVDAGTTPPRRFFSNDQEYQAAMDRDESFTRSCQMEIGRNPETGKALPREVCDRQRQQAFENGWRNSAEEAIAHIRNLEGEMKMAAAAERLYKDKSMSEKAQREAAAIDASTPDILPEIPEAPRVKKLHWKTAKKLSEDAAKSAAA